MEARNMRVITTSIYLLFGLSDQSFFDRYRLTNLSVFRNDKKNAFFSKCQYTNDMQMRFMEFLPDSCIKFYFYF